MPKSVERPTWPHENWPCPAGLPVPGQEVPSASSGGAGTSEAEQVADSPHPGETGPLDYWGAVLGTGFSSSAIPGLGWSLQGEAGFVNADASFRILQDQVPCPVLFSAWVSFSVALSFFSEGCLEVEPE